MARVEKSELQGVEFKYENIAGPGEPEQIVRVALAQYKTGLFDEEAGVFVASTTERRTFNDINPAHVSVVDGLVGQVATDLSKSVDKVTDERDAALAALAECQSAGQSLAKDLEAVTAERDKALSQLSNTQSLVALVEAAGVDLNKLQSKVDEKTPRT